MQLQEQISALENLGDFRSEEELNVIIQDCTSKKTACSIAIELKAQLSKSQDEIAKLQQKIEKLQQEIQKGMASPNFIPAKQLHETKIDIIDKQIAIHKAEAIRSKIDQTKRSSGFLTENELKRAKCVLQNIKVWQL